MISESQLKGKFLVVNPNFKNSDRSLNTVLESTNSDFHRAADLTCKYDRKSRSACHDNINKWHSSYGRWRTSDDV